MEELKCPNCSTVMKKERDPDITTDVCPGCGGIFLEKGELNALATGMAGDIEYCSVDREEHADRFATRSCPKCTNQKMEKVNLLRFSDLIFDYCHECEGFFLDKGEIESMNLELKKLSPGGTSGEYRSHKDDHLVRVNQVSDITMGGPMSAMTGGAMQRPVGVMYIQAEVYFKTPLNMDLRIHAEKWTAKLAKILGISGSDDIAVGNDKFDGKFIVHGSDKTKIIGMLSPEVQNLMLQFVSKRPKILSESGSLEVLDDKVVYTEGPYTGEIKVDLGPASAGIIDDLLRIAILIES